MLYTCLVYSCCCLRQWTSGYHPGLDRCRQPQQSCTWCTHLLALPVSLFTSRRCYSQVRLWRFLPECDYVALGSLLSQIRLSSVCLSVCSL